jgi:uncharacterized repeat protein (TIGR03803 family)
MGGLLNVDGTLYGTTFYGGTAGVYGHGTVYSITPSGAEVVLYRFAGSPSDGGNPSSNLINVGGTLYGTTKNGGKHNKGTVFSITPSGTERMLHSFGGSSDGTYPSAALLDVGGTLYGTTAGGGSGPCKYYFPTVPGCGTVFSITTGGTEKVLYSFKGDPDDGAYPVAPLISVNGTLYGTTFLGDSAKCLNVSPGCGTVFAITTSGSETVLHRFGGKRDGTNPAAGLIDVKGTLYGTTEQGGVLGGFGGGTVFTITTAGKLTVLHRFDSSNDGRLPMAAMSNVHGTLYGTTYEGGGSGLGTVFAVTASGKEAVLHRFSDRHAFHPSSGLADLNGTLYGTTPQGDVSGGRGDDEYGTVFSIAP